MARHTRRRTHPLLSGALLSPFDEAFLREYKRRHPHLFPKEAIPAPAPRQGGYLPRSASNGYDSEAAFQTDVVRQLVELGWHVQESLKGSSGGGAVWYGVGWPDLVIYRPDRQRRLWFAELKQPGNKPTGDQLACHARLREAGFTVLVAWTLQAVLDSETQERLR